MRVLNIGSLNIDYVYTVDHFVRPGETLSSHRYQVFSGGKGFNQSIALTRAKAHVAHAGKVGKDGAWLKELLEKNGVDASNVAIADGPTGHAIIQVSQSGENAILLHGGANQCLTETDVTHALASCSAGDYLLVQNETSSVEAAIRQGAARGLRVVFNPAPFTSAIRSYPLNLVDIFILNEIEAAGLTGKTDPEEIGTAMGKEFPKALTVLTLGRMGAMCFEAGARFQQQAEKVKAVDTTAAGDTFIGYFLSELMRTGEKNKALQLGCRAAAVCVTRPGAADSIPQLTELDNIPPAR